METYSNQKMDSSGQSLNGHTNAQFFIMSMIVICFTFIGVWVYLEGELPLSYKEQLGIGQAFGICVLIAMQVTVIRGGIIESKYGSS